MIVSKKLRQSAMDRFREKCAVDPSGCWLWVASVNKGRGGYGKFSLNCKAITAHRASWLLHFGPIPDGMHVLHKCDVPRCVNPSHLFLGTNAENVADMDRKSRRVNAPRRGEQNWRARLTEEKVLEIRKSAMTQEALAGMYGVSRSAISAIRRGETWAYLK